VESTPESLLALVAELEAGGLARKEAILAAAKQAGVPKREVYDLVHKGSQKENR